MTLPLLTTPTYDLTLTSIGQEIKYRPFLVKEEKLLLIAMEGGEQKDIFTAVKAILKACILTEDVDIDKLPQFDIEYLFLNIRAKSVGEIIELRISHTDETNSKGDKCAHIEEVNVNIDDIKINGNDKMDPRIKITDTIGVILTYPTLEILNSMKEQKSQVSTIFELVLKCVDQIWDAQNVYEAKDHTEEELLAFLESLNKDQFSKISEFFENMPKLKHKVTYTCSACGTEETLEVEGLQSFFV